MVFTVLVRGLFVGGFGASASAGIVTAVMIIISRFPFLFILPPGIDFSTYLGPSLVVYPNGKGSQEPPVWGTSRRGTGEKVTCNISFCNFLLRLWDRGAFQDRL